MFYLYPFSIVLHVCIYNRRKHNKIVAEQLNSVGKSLKIMEFYEICVGNVRGNTFFPQNLKIQKFWRSFYVFPHEIQRLGTSDDHFPRNLRFQKF